MSNKQGYTQYFKQPRPIWAKKRAPMDAFTFPAPEHFSGTQQTAFLKSFIDSIPDELPGEKIKIYLDTTSDSLDEMIAEKLIIEEL